MDRGADSEGRLAGEYPSGKGMAWDEAEGTWDSRPAPRRPQISDPGWRVGRFLGEGGAAAVWLVERTADGTRYALKIPGRPGTLADEFDLRRELAILSRFRHENLLEVHGLLATAGETGLLLEYAPGDSLGRLVAARKKLTEGEAVTVLVAVARALACLHADGAAHGDVSPGNVLFTAYGKPLLADFGTSRMLGEGRDSAVGTPGFAAPPVDGANGRVTGAGLEADVYALGALGWFMLTGRPLVPGLRPPLSVVLPGLPAEMRKLLDAALDDEPGRRPAAEAFAAEIFRAWPAEPIDLLSSVHPSVRPELRTRRSALEHGRAPAGRLRLGKRRRPGKPRRPGRPPWEEPGRDRRKGLFPLRSGNGSSKDPGQGYGRRPGRHPAWLGAAAAVVALTTLFGGAAILVPEALSPAKEEFIQTSTGKTPPSAAGAGAGPEGQEAGSGTAGGPDPQEAIPGTEGANPVPHEAVSGTPADTAAGSSEQDGPPTEAEVSVLTGGDPVAAVRVLSAVRARAYAAGEPELLTWVNQPDTAAAAADLAQVERLHRRGERLSGLSVDVVHADRLGPGAADGPDPGEQPPGELVAVTAASSAYAQIRADGTPVAAPGAAGRQELILEVVRTDGGWRIGRVLPAAAGLERGGRAQR